MLESNLTDYWAKRLPVRLKLNKALHIHESDRNWILLEQPPKNNEYSVATVSEVVGYVSSLRFERDKENISISPFPNAFLNERTVGNISVALNYVDNIETIVESEISRLLKLT